MALFSRSEPDLLAGRHLAPSSSTLSSATTTTSTISQSEEQTVISESQLPVINVAINKPGHSGNQTNLSSNQIKQLRQLESGVGQKSKVVLFWMRRSSSLSSCVGLLILSLFLPTTTTTPVNVEIARSGMYHHTINEGPQIRESAVNMSVKIGNLSSGVQRLFFEAHNALGNSPNPTYLGEFNLTTSLDEFKPVRSGSCSSPLNDLSRQDQFILLATQLVLLARFIIRAPDSWRRIRAQLNIFNPEPDETKPAE